MIPVELKIKKGIEMYIYGKKTHRFNYVMCLEVLRETENKVPEMYALIEHYLVILFVWDIISV